MKDTMPNLQTWQPGPPAKTVDETNMLDTNATETPDTVTSKNTNKEDTNPTPAFGDLGAHGKRA